MNASLVVTYITVAENIILTFQKQSSQSFAEYILSQLLMQNQK